MSGASRLLMLLANPFPLHPRPSFIRLARRSLSTHDHLPIYHSTPLPLHPKKLKTKTQNQRASIFKCQLHNNSVVPFESKGSSGSSAVQGNLSWPEWAKFVESLSDGGYFSRGSVGGDDDEIVGIEGMPAEFSRAARACLAFARDWPDALRLLAKKNIEVIVNSGSPSLFKNGTSSTRRMRLFLSGDESNVLEFERAQTVDVMRYLLSFAYDSLNISEGTKQSDIELVEASIRNVLVEFVNMNGTVQSSNVTESTTQQPPVNYEQFSRPPVQNIEMKRGDWICPKCTFMNFARNRRCLECEEARPMRQLTGREWECPQCDFSNYGRNTLCLRCDCKRPVDIPPGTLYSKNSTVDQILSGSKTKAENSELEQRLAASDEKTDRLFSSKADMGSAAADDDFPKVMPLRKGETPLQKRLANSSSGVPNVIGSNKSSESSINETLDRILGRTSTTRSTSKTDPDYVPFVPLPPDMFSKPQNTINDVQQMEDGSKDSNDSSDASVRWSKKVAELDNVTNVANTTPDEDFPDIMPMRKGENRFVVSKKKDRSLTSPQYKRRLAMEQANKSDFVPFVPFPPGYFAQKDKQPEAAAPPNSEAISDSSASAENVQAESRTYSQNRSTQFSGNNSDESKKSWNRGISETSNASNSASTTWGSSNLETGKSQISHQSWNSGVSQTNVEGQKSQSSSQSCDSGTSHMSNASNTSSTSLGSSNLGGVKSQSSSQNWNKGFTGKSLEGSAVTEPDPLDMSEEAKAARWFRRAAQIKNISELSEIPDEDFPEIMPMRKGVNRFVVSKRKTPLERRLTSPQYRRNLPIVSSEPEKDSS